METLGLHTRNVWKESSYYKFAKTFAQARRTSKLDLSCEIELRTFKVDQQTQPSGTFGEIYTLLCYHKAYYPVHHVRQLCTEVMLRWP
jgi:hypothetical protein